MRERRTVGEIIRRAVVMEALVVMGVVALAFGALLVERSVAAKERHDQAVLLNLESFEFQVLNAETGFRGFALSHREPFLAPYRDAFPAIARLRPKLLAAVQHEDRSSMNEAFRVIADWKRVFAEPALADFRSGTGRLAESSIQAGEGKRRIDRIRNLVNQLRVHALADVASARAERRDIGYAALAIVPLGLLVAIAGGWRAAVVLQRAVVRPMSRLADAAERIRRGDLSARAEVRGAVEVAQVGRSFNQMAAEVETVVETMRELDELKTRFLSTVSHELRTPLTSISGYLQLLEQGVVGELSPEQLNYVNVAQRNGERLASLIDDLLMLSRFDANRVDMAREPVDLARQLRNLREEMQPVAEKGDSRLALDAPDELVVEGDTRRLQQSFANLVSNAIKFNRAGGEVRISAAARNGHAVVEVSDQGVGIPRNELERIGERFFRATTTTNMPGTGLGLAITKEIVARHGGTLEIESEVGRGSTFRITLPRSPSGGAV